MDYKFPMAIDLREVAKKAHFWISDTRLEYYGYCQECRKK
jgi:Fe2+ or Zn2+ uptake regulation protein